MGEKVTRKLIGQVGVDSGQVMVGDPCYIHVRAEGMPDDKTDMGLWTDAFTTDSRFDPVKGRYVNLDGTDFRPEQLRLNYDGACLASLGRQYQLYYELGHAGAAVCVPSGYGDGSYPVYGEFNAEGRCLRLIVDFEAEQETTEEGE